MTFLCYFSGKVHFIFESKKVNKPAVFLDKIDLFLRKLKELNDLILNLVSNYYVQDDFTSHIPFQIFFSSKNMTTKSQLKPQIVYSKITLGTYACLALIINAQNSLLSIGKLTSIVLPVLIISELLKYVLIKKLYQINISSSSTGNNTKTNNASMVFIEEYTIFVVLLVSSILIFGFVAVILGAPPLNNYEETLSLSSVLTILSVLPCLLLLGTRLTLRMFVVNKVDLVSMAVEVYVEEFLQNCAIGAILGAWVGSVVMPLDWDRSWQAYPIPNIVGAMGGHLVGCYFSILKTVLLNAKKELKRKSLL